MSHGLHNLPYRIHRHPKSPHHQVVAIAKCQAHGCNSVREITLTKNLPYHVVITKFYETGWSGKGHHSEGIPGSLICPKCRPKRDSNTHKKEVEDIMEKAKIGIHTYLDTVKMSVSARAQGKQNRINYAVEICLPKIVWSDLGRKPRCKFLTRTTLQLGEGTSRIQGVKATEHPNEVTFRFGSTKVPFHVPNEVLGRTPLKVSINKETSTITILDLQDQFSILHSGIVNGKLGDIEPKGIEHTEVAGSPKPIEKKEGYSIEDGTSLREMFNAWVEQMEAASWKIELEILNNRLSVHATMEREL